MVATARIIGRMTTIPALWPLPPTRSLRRQRPPSNALILLRDEDLRLPHAGGSPCILQAHAAPHFSLSVTLSQSTSIVRPALVALPVPFAASQHIPPPDDAMSGTGCSMSIEARWEVPPSAFSAHNSKTTSAFVSDGHCLFCAGPHRLARQRPDSIDSQESLQLLLRLASRNLVPLTPGRSHSPTYRSHPHTRQLTHAPSRSLGVAVYKLSCLGDQAHAPVHADTHHSPPAHVPRAEAQQAAVRIRPLDKPHPAAFEGFYRPVEPFSRNGAQHEHAAAASKACHTRQRPSGVQSGVPGENPDGAVASRAELDQGVPGQRQDDARLPSAAAVTIVGAATGAGTSAHVNHSTSPDVGQSHPAQLQRRRSCSRHSGNSPVPKRVRSSQRDHQRGRPALG